jgi:hypothetical protein
MAKKPSICPPGVWCLTPTLGFLIAIGIAIALYFLVQANNVGSNSVVERTQYQRKQQQPVHVYNNISTSSSDNRYTRSPEPLRVWETQPDLRGALIPPGAVPINVYTRGLPQAYQQMGIIKSGEQLLPLYGRQTTYRSDRYNYYTRTDTYNPVQLPVKYQKRDCMDAIGCDELYGGESVKSAGLGKEGHVEVYKFDGPSYIPGLV